MDVMTLVYLSMGISAFLMLFFVVSTIRIIWFLSDIKMELRALNDNQERTG